MFRISPDGSTLTMTGAHTSDSGKYTCVATNAAGEEDRIFNLNVYGRFDSNVILYYLYLSKYILNVIYSANKLHHFKVSSAF